MGLYHFPPIDKLEESREASNFLDGTFIQKLINRLEDMFAAFGLDIQILEHIETAYTLVFRLKLGGDIKPSAVMKLKSDIELAMYGQPVEMRSEPGDKQMSLAVLDIRRPPIHIKDAIRSSSFMEAKSVFSIAAGIDHFGTYTTIDLARLPNLLVVGVSGTGKTTFLNSVILSILYKARPDEVKFVLVDTKGVDLPLMNGIPHLLMPTIRYREDGISTLRFIRNETTERLALLRQKKAKSIDEFNQYSGEKKPRLVMIIDEFADLVREYGKEEIKEIETIIKDIARHSRETGIHLILATQSSKPEVFSPEMKIAIPCLACLTTWVDDSVRKTVEELTGVSSLCGDGDMIILNMNEGWKLHLQGSLATDGEIDRVVAFLRDEQLAERE